MLKNGMWNPPESNDRVDEAVSVFYHLCKGRGLIAGGMSPIGDKYLSEQEITAYLNRNPPTFDSHWFEAILYACDDKYIELSKKRWETSREKNKK